MSTDDIFDELKRRSEASTNATIARLHTAMDAETERAHALAEAPVPPPPTSEELEHMAALDAGRTYAERLEGRARQRDERFPLNPHGD